MGSPSPIRGEIFISYAHLDNNPLSLRGQTKQGWVSVFHYSLGVLLAEKLGDEPAIWRDNKKSPNQPITPTILNRLPTVAVMISIISPRYVNSPWCLDEVNIFVEAAQVNGGLIVSDRSRVVKVVKTPLDEDDKKKVPSVFADLDGYDFFEPDDGGDPREFRPEFGPEEEQNFLLKVDDVAREISRLIKALKALAAEAALPAAESLALEAPREQLAGNGSEGHIDPNSLIRFDDPPRKESEQKQPTAVFLAASPDLGGARDNIKRDLEQRGYVVLPDESKLPRQAEEFKKQVRADLIRCSLSIHLIGREYGDSPGGEGLSYMQLQYDLAAERDHEPNFSRLIWMPKSLRPEEGGRDLWLWKLTNDCSPGISDILETSLEDFKTAIQDRIAAISRDPQPPSVRRDVPLIYLIYEDVDAAVAGRLDDHLYQNKCNVLMP